ncbi:MAG: phage tail protein [Armatimonadota bacterium]|nr:phage tail protein [bacterium]
MIVGSYGGIVFETSSDMLFSFDSLHSEASARIETTDIIGRRPALKFLGPGGETVTFNMRLCSTYVDNPLIEYNRLRDMRDSGKAATLVIGSKPFPSDRAAVKWVIESLSADLNHFSRHGEPKLIEIQVTLKEYSRSETQSNIYSGLPASISSTTA